MEEDNEAAEAAARVRRPSPRRRMEPSRSDSGANYEGRNFLKATKIGPLSKSAENYSLDHGLGKNDTYDPLSVTSSISIG